MKHKNTQPLYIFNRENPQKSEPQNGPRRGLDFIALIKVTPSLSDVVLDLARDTSTIDLGYDKGIVNVQFPNHHK